MRQEMVTAKTVDGLRLIVNRKLNEGWRWVNGGGSVATCEPKHVSFDPPIVGGFWAVLEKPPERPPAGLVK